MTASHPTASRNPVALELAVQDLAGARVAAAVGARRVELCAALGATGGVTPGIGLVGAVVDAMRHDPTAHAGGVEVHVLVRSRPGGFVLTREELAVQAREVRAARAAGAAGVVVGALTPDGSVDAAAMVELVEAAEGAEVTFHRAFDVVSDPTAALDALAAAGVTRVLTSGGAARAVDGLERLRATAHRASALAPRLQIMAGGGVRVEDIAALVAAGVDAVHLSARRSVVDDGGPGGGGDQGYEVTDPGTAAAASAALRRATASG
jgi:copper homeostasis protein